MSMEDVDRDDELSAGPDDVARVAADERALDIHTSLPGIIKSFDPTKLTAKVQPAIKRRWRDAGFLALPELVDCPVQFQRWGGICLLGAPQPGDECFVSFSERAIDNWHHVGGVQEPSEFRLHDYSDGFVFPGFWSEPEAAKIKDFPTTGVELRTLDGSTLIRIEDNMVILGQKAGAQPATMGDVQKAINDAIATHTHVTSCGAGAGTASASAQLATLPDPRAAKVKIF